MKGENVFGVVPIVYIPHIRDHGFLGNSIINDTVIGIIKEMNMRWADLGDAISNDAHDLIVGADIVGSVTFKQLPDGRPYVDIGQSSGMEGHQKPSLTVSATKSASEPMLKFGNKLDSMYRRETNHPAVADGEDEGSQRSSLTLNTRMWPLVSHVELERQTWSVGMTTFLKIIITMMNVKGLGGVTKEALDYKFKVEWPPMLPRDREALVTELSTRKAAKLGSQTHLMSLLDDIQYPDEQFEEILDEEKRLAEAVAAEKDKTDPSAKDKKPTKDDSLTARSERSSTARVEKE
jgi:hypothetical protein